MISKQNYSGAHLADVPLGETEFVSCNFAQEAPDMTGPTPKGVRIFPDNIPRTFIRCNLVNCEPPPGSTIDRCTTALCEVIQTGSDDIVVDGVTVSSTPILVQYNYGKVLPDGSYEIFPVPEEYPL